MAALWRLMEEGSLPKYPSLMINAHPDVAALPAGVKIVLVQGSEEEVLAAAARLRRARQGAAGLARGAHPDGHAQAVLPLPHRREEWPPAAPRRQARAGVAPQVRLPAAARRRAARRPPALCLPIVVRRLHERGAPRARDLPRLRARQLRRFWASADQKGLDAERALRRAGGFGGFAAVAGLFYSEPSVGRFYVPNRSTDGLDVRRVERIENGALHETMDAGYGVVKKNLERIGCPYENGVHARWLFHGAGSAEIVDEIVNDPQVGFKPWYNERGLWGQGVYFARDAVYSVECPGCCDECYDEEGDRMLMLCLVQTGLPTVGGYLKRHAQGPPDEPISRTTSSSTTVQPGDVRHGASTAPTRVHPPFS